MFRGYVKCGSQLVESCGRKRRSFDERNISDDSYLDDSVVDGDYGVGLDMLEKLYG